MSDRRLRRHCVTRLRNLPLSVPSDARILCEQVARARGWPIRLIPMAGPSGVAGLWMATAHTDLIFYEEVTTPPHQEHIILHELNYVLCDHYSASLPVQVLLPGLDPGVVRRVLGRSGYSTEEEREADCSPR